ncbi:MAG: hypothetical protein O9972_55670 [Burkholderiales bacterium]|nr:hypothetical protein [Burkholderiales bacterium]
MAASEDTVDGEGLEFRTPKGGVSLDTLKSSEPVKSKVIGKAPSKLKESAGDGIYVLDNGTYLCCLHHQAHPIFRKLIGQLLGCVELFLFVVREKDKPNFPVLVLNLSSTHNYTDIPHIFIYFYIVLHSPRCFDEKPSL